MTEEWRPVAGAADGYLVSNEGRIRSPRGLRKPVVNGATGYPCVSIRINGHIRLRPVHILVAESFLGARPEGGQVDHIDRNRQNPRLLNLRYVTRSENMLNTDRLRGELNGRARLTEAQAREIIALPRPLLRGKRGSPSGSSLRALAAHYGVGKITISDLLRGVTWKHLHAVATEHNTPPNIPTAETGGEG